MEVQPQGGMKQLKTVVAPPFLRYLLLVIPAWFLVVFAVVGLRELELIPEPVVGLVAYGLFTYALAAVYAATWVIYPRARLLKTALTLVFGGWEIILIWCVWRVLEPVPGNVIPDSEGPWLVGCFVAIVVGMLILIPTAIITPRVHIKWGHGPKAPVWEYDDR